MRSVRVLKATRGKLVNGRFVATSKNPERITRAGKKAKRKRLQEMLREAGVKNPKTGEFLKVHSVRANENGTFDVVVLD